MTATLTTSRPFEPGTTGWTIDDLDDPEIERQWETGAYEIVEGVLTKMPPGYYDSALPVQRLIRIVTVHLDATGAPGEFATEVDLVLARNRILRVDALFITPDVLRQQAKAWGGRGTRRIRYGRGLVPPPLVIESLSLGHEDHDRQTKRRWYAEAGVPNYWLLDAFEKSLECLVLKDKEYAADVSGRGDDQLRPRLFPGLVLPLAKLWGM